MVVDLNLLVMDGKQSVWAEVTLEPPQIILKNPRLSPAYSYKDHY
jgi:hypothetical protein